MMLLITLQIVGLESLIGYYEAAGIDTGKIKTQDGCNLKAALNEALADLRDCL